MLVIILCIVFFSSMAMIIKTMLEYRTIDALYENSAKEFTIAVDKGLSEETEEESDAVPITVDFKALQKVNEDVVGWIYCEGTDINYPVLQGTDNIFYLSHTYDKKSARAGSIFVEALNTSDFEDSNTIIYGHHMKNGSMFATLEKWQEQEYYEEHPVFWLLTPEQTYRILLFSGYTTTADSDTYIIFQGGGPEFEDYLRASCQNSDFEADVEWDVNKKFVVLSTCSYVFEDARYVLHGMMEPYKMD